MYDFFHEEYTMTRTLNSTVEKSIGWHQTFGVLPLSSYQGGN